MKLMYPPLAKITPSLRSFAISLILFSATFVEHMFVVSNLPPVTLTLKRRQKIQVLLKTQEDVDASRVIYE